jgi:hypothetical protein
MPTDNSDKAISLIRANIKQKRAEAREIGRSLILIGERLLCGDPERMLMEGEAQPSDPELDTQRLRPDLDQRFSKKALMKLLREIRNLRRQAGKLEKTAKHKASLMAHLLSFALYPGIRGI